MSESNAPKTPGAARAKPLRARPRNPLTGRQVVLRASSPRELEAYSHRVQSLRTELRLGMRERGEVARELGHMRHGLVTLERAALAYVERPGLAANTRRGVRALLAADLRPFAARRLASLDVPTVTAWVESMTRRGLATSTIDLAWRRLRAVALYALERGWIEALPWGESYRPRIHGRVRAPREGARTVAEFVALLHAARELDARAYSGLEAKLALAGLLGLRQGELAGLRWSDVAWGPPISIVIARQWGGAPVKAKRVLRLESIAELGPILERHADRLRASALLAPTGPIFPDPRTSAPGGPRHYASGEVIARLDIRAAVKLGALPHPSRWSAHSLRDTFVTLEVAAAGGDLTRVQTRSRHASLSSLARYVRTLERNHPAPPALTALPGLDADGAGPVARLALPAPTHQPSSKTP